MPIPVIAPAVWSLVAGGSAAGAYAWYDPDFFTNTIWSNADLDQRVETLNNYWVNLERVVNGRVDYNSDAARQLRRHLDGWVAFKRRYNDSIVKRAFDPFGLWGAKADFEKELTEIWAPRFIDTMQKAIAADELIRKALESRNVDVDAYMHRSNLNPDGSSKGGNVGLYIGVGVTVLLLGIGAVLASRGRPRIIRV